MSTPEPTTEPLNAWQLADLAGCGAPDAPDSPGATFLLRVADAVADQREDFDPRDPSDYAHDIADTAVPIGTWEMWRTFTDLTAWDQADEWADEMGGLTIGGPRLNDHGNGMTAVAAIGLYRVAEALVLALVSEWDDDDETDEDDDDPEWQCASPTCGVWFRSADEAPRCPECGGAPLV